MTLRPAATVSFFLFLLLPAPAAPLGPLGPVGTLLSLMPFHCHHLILLKGI